ncbi:MAG: phosphate signaling complex protein PhoU [Clostridiaceae bacterium]|nr:phosphate signaling complex protein PhoU [Clostridiaceae bacterium]
MRNRFDRQLEELNEQLIEMGSMCGSAVALVAKALADNDMELARRAVETDMKIDKMERDIESLCLKLLLQQQPVAKDLRMISAALKMITDMERIGDQVSDISEILFNRDLSAACGKVPLREMFQNVVKMVTDSIESYVKKDLELARGVMEHDDIVDGLFDEIKFGLINMMTTGRESSEDAIDLLMISKYLERIGDHSTNIAEWVEFSITGIHISEEIR